jgi:hypothetical protein
MSSIAAIPELNYWDTPPSHSGWRSLQPVFCLDLQVYWQNKKGIDRLYALGDALDTATEEDLEGLVDLLAGVLQTLEGYLKVRGTATLTLRRIRQQRAVVEDALESIKRGYAPGRMPSEEERSALARKRLRHIA